MNKSPWRLEEVDGSPWRLEEVDGGDEQYPVTTRKKATSRVGKMATSSAGTRATSIALQLIVSSSVGAPALLLKS